MSNVSSSNSQGVRVPKLRFPGFEGEWRETPISDLLDFQNGINAAAEKYGSGIKYISVSDILNLPYITYDTIKGLVDIDGNTLDNFAVNYGDILFQRSSETQEDIGHSNVYLDSKTATFGGFVIRGRKIGEYNPVFFKHLLDTQNARKVITRLGAGAQHYNIGQDSLRTIQLYFPKTEEQNKISELLLLIDKKISLYKIYIELLKSYKRGVSTALFTQKLRLSKTCLPHNTEWSKKYLGDIFSERTERAAGNERLLAVTINYGVQDRTELDLKDNSSDDKRNYRVVHIGDLAYNTMRMWQGACGVSAFDGIVSPAYTVLYITDNTENYAPFWGYYFKETSMLQTFQRNSQGLTSDTWNLKYEKFAHISVYAPPFQEQLQIADFLDRISDKIAANENFLNSLVKFKCGLLSLLFI